MKIFEVLKKNIPVVEEELKQSLKGKMKDIVQEGLEGVKEKNLFKIVLEKFPNLSELQIKQNTELVKKIWKSKDLEDLVNGKITLSEQSVNEYIQKGLSKDNEWQELAVAFANDNIIEISAKSSKVGRLFIKGRIENLCHNKEESLLNIAIIEQQLIDRPALSWILSSFLSSFLVKLYGPIKIGKKLKIELTGNKLEVDFRDALYENIGKRFFLGDRLLDVIEIKAITLEAEKAIVTTNLTIGENKLDLLRLIINER